MRMHRRAALAAVALLSAIPLATASLTACSSSSSKVSGEVTVLAAASLKDAFQEIGDKVKEDNPDLTINFDFQGSQDLVASLAGGNKADVLATANNSTMKDAADQSLVGEQTEFATNVLTLIVPKGNPKKVTGLDSSLDNADLVICAPKVPCGEATGKLTSALGITLKPVSEEQKVTDVRGKVESGEAGAGIVYTTDAAVAGDKVEKIDIPDGGVVNHYPIAATASPSNPEGAKAFIDAVTGTTGQEILAKYGFGAPGGASAAPSSGAMTAAPSSMPSAAPEASEAASPSRTGKPDEAGNKPDTETATP